MIYTINVFFVAWENAENIESLEANPESLKYKHAFECNCRTDNGGPQYHEYLMKSLNNVLYALGEVQKMRSVKNR